MKKMLMVFVLALVFGAACSDKKSETTETVDVRASSSPVAVETRTETETKTTTEEKSPEEIQKDAEKAKEKNAEESKKKFE